MCINEPPPAPANAIPLKFQNLHNLFNKYVFSIIYPVQTAPIALLRQKQFPVLSPAP